MNKFENVYKLAEELGANAQYGVAMSTMTTFKIGGAAGLYIEAETKKQLSSLIKYMNDNKIDYIVLGKGSNVLVNDNGIDKVVIKLKGEFCEVSMLDDTTIYCGAGLSLAGLCKEAESKSLSGLEFAWGIPGSVGGAAFMNAGAYGGEMKDVLYSVTHIDKHGKLGVIKSSDLDLGYRHSIYKVNGFTIIGVTLKLKLDSKNSIRERMDDYMGRRKDKQPLEFPSAGSVFRRPEGNYAGALIEKCGLKGKSVGGAQVSPKHAGFIVNTGSATAEDVKNLVALIQKTVKKETGYSLQREIIFLD
ncbi:MAG: UDP-N-acetylmuramate dehydrogenase [Ruminococcus sp.]|jgi:UDP-N-acetylmuramate dehydrogenase|nr:UDP-N-acetylmuramate dehydrogenase [Ruminococcus sp.]